jgi:FeS assembly protein IscX
MISPVELHRILAEWRVRLQRAKEILQPPAWKENDWRQFSQALALMVRDHGRSWIIDPNVYWDLRWNLQDGGELVCQIEHIPNEKTSLVVAQNGGFAESVGSYTWLWAEFNPEGDFARDPYWVEGTWKDALTALLVPLDRQSAYLLAGRAETPDALLLQEGARPNDHQVKALMAGDRESTRDQSRPMAEASFRPEPESHLKWVKTETPSQEPQPTADSSSTGNGLAPDSLPPLEAPSVEAVPDTAVAAGDGRGVNPAAGQVDTPAPFAIRWGMPQKLTWKDTDDLAYALIDAHPDQDPLKLSFPKLHKLVVELPDFGDAPDKSSESILESIQMAWYEEVK